MRTAERARTEVREGERERVRRGLVWCAGVFVAMRIGLSVLALAGVGLLPDPTLPAAEAAGVPAPVGVPGRPAPEVEPGWQNVVTAWERFDALWFLRIAEDGYRPGDGSAAFFPLYPLVIRGVSAAIGGHPLAAALLISNLALLGALVVLYFLTAAEWGERAARRATVALAVFPTSFFLLAPYSESLFLFLALLAFWGARRGRWEVAAAAGAAAAATRSIGIVLAPALLVEAIHQHREGRAALARGVPAAAAVGVGLLGYLAYWKTRSGAWLAPLTFQQNWEREPSMPWETVWDGTAEAFRWIGIYPGGYHLLDWLIVVPVLAAAVWVAARARPTYAVFAWASLLVPLSYVFPPRPFMSLPRFSVTIFPILWAAAVWTADRPGIRAATLGWSAALMGLLTVLFVNWYFVF